MDRGERFLAKIAVELKQALADREAACAPGIAAARVLARGPGWRVADMMCTSGPQDRRFEEQHSDVSIAVVLAGSFQYRASANGSRARNELMTPGSLLLGAAGQCFECGHEHGAGDRCVSFWYAPEYFEEIAADSGGRLATGTFPVTRIPPLSGLSPIVARVDAGLTNNISKLAWEELSLKLAESTLELVHGLRAEREPSASDQARVTAVIRAIEQSLEADWSVGKMAAEAGLSAHHFLRTFEAVAGVTPHQFLVRTRLREAAIRLKFGKQKVLDVAFDCGFGDVSNFNRAFRREFGVSPKAYRTKS